jgi:hypothetical protein
MTGVEQLMPVLNQKRGTVIKRKDVFSPQRMPPIQTFSQAVRKLSLHSRSKQTENASRNTSFSMMPNGQDDRAMSLTDFINVSIPMYYTV